MQGYLHTTRAIQLKNEAEKPTKSGDGSMVQHEETVTESSVVKRRQRQPQSPQSLLKRNPIIQVMMMKNKKFWKKEYRN